jgi:hypothetical protein
VVLPTASPDVPTSASHDPAPAEKPPPVPPPDLLRAVIELQDNGGWWPSTESLLALVKVTPPASTGAELGTTGKGNEIIAAIMALGMLRATDGLEMD